MLELNADKEFETLYGISVYNIEQFFQLYRFGKKEEAYRNLNYHLPKFIAIMRGKIKGRNLDKKFIPALDKLIEFDRILEVYGVNSTDSNFDKLVIHAEDNFGLRLQSRVILDVNPYEDYPD